MAITQSQIELALYRRMANVYGRHVTGSDDELKATLVDLSERGDFLFETDTSITTTKADYDYTLPDFIRTIRSLSLSDNGRELTEATISQFRQWVSKYTTVPEGIPDQYTVHGDTLYLSRAPDGVYTVTIDYVRRHPQVVSPIEFDDKFFEAIVNGVIARLWLDRLKGQDNAVSEAVKHTAMYDTEVARLIDVQPAYAVITRYRDI